MSFADRMAAVCPRPDKHRYLDRSTAVQQLGSFAKDQRKKGPKWDTLEPYKCVCGFWHLGRPRAAS